MEFDVTILGSNSAIPAHGRNQTAQLVNVGLTYMLIDCGEGTQIQLRRFKLKYSRIDYIFISHLHGDHYFGLMGMISTFHLHKRSKLLTIYGPQGLDEIITTQLKYSNTRLNFPLRFIQTNPSEKELILEEKNFKVFSIPLKHRLPCTGFLIQEKPGLLRMNKEVLLENRISVEAINTLRKGIDFVNEDEGITYLAKDFTLPPKPLRSYAFCSDTIYDPIDLIENLQGVTTLYHESTFADDEMLRAKETFHSTATQAGDIASKLKVKKLLLGHFSTRYIDLDLLLQQAKSKFKNSFLSEEGITYPID
ncbi:metal-dependent hydrolase, beta-lactamase superfamily III [Belliella baltica DSM 15883]|uniref:Ribonuclease Z n=1 Tax=Belliella baltica (strain DSM 15883 / CIP 108006 / LMG 21964 / BA134) TaxID=866536 RepID=I3Z902_BELBD|nr:ribonuclease Z [Belliella baltica]AFL85720.1 metal-dependent hydrolase, beta-lactamase superfamily III [Belliella baltica DSM 15883]